MLIDTHCHLTAAQYTEDLPDVVQRAREHGIDHIVTVAEDLQDAEACIALSNKYEHIYCTAGTHPGRVHSWQKGDGERLRALCLESNKVRAIGEIGLDYHYAATSEERSLQRAIFLEQLSLSRELILPAVLHCREAVEDLRAIVRDVEPVQVVIHCCTERWEDVEWFIERGYMLSFTGMVTFSKADIIRETVRRCPRDRLMLETDGPYLAPVPYRGKRNEPAYLQKTAQAIADIWNISVEEVCAQTTQNAVEFYGLPGSSAARACSSAG